MCWWQNVQRKTYSVNVYVVPTKCNYCRQPIYMGIIYVFKCHFRHYLMQPLITNIEVDSYYDLVRSVATLDAVNWIGLAVKHTKEKTMFKRFAKAAFMVIDDVHDINETSKNIIMSNLYIRKTFNCNVDYQWAFIIMLNLLQTF